MAPTLGYWNIRGLAEPIRTLLTYVGDNFEDKRYQVGPAPELDRSDWNNVKFNFDLDFPNLPYYIDGDIKLTQSAAIIRHVARKHDLLGKNEKERARVDLLSSQIEDYRNRFTSMCYDKDYEKLKPSYLADLPNVMKALSNFLGKNKYFAGDNITFVDFLAYEFLFQNSVFQADALDAFANLKEFKQSFESLPAISDYLKNPKVSKQPFNNPAAKFGNKHF